jgi:hypothetical protein
MRTTNAFTWRRMAGYFGGWSKHDLRVRLPERAQTRYLAYVEFPPTWGLAPV